MMVQRQPAESTLVAFTLGALHCAIPIHSVKEVLIPSLLTALPHAPAAVAGVIDHRGEVILILDLRRRFGLGTWTEAPKPKWVLIQVGGRSVGLAVDSVDGVFRTPASALRPAPELGADANLAGIVGVTNRLGILTFILDVTEFEALTRVMDGRLLGQMKGLS